MSFNGLNANESNLHFVLLAQPFLSDEISVFGHHYLMLLIVLMKFTDSEEIIGK